MYAILEEELAASIEEDADLMLKIAEDRENREKLIESVSDTLFNALYISDKYFSEKVCYVDRYDCPGEVRM